MLGRRAIKLGSKYCITADYADLKLIPNALTPLFSNQNHTTRQKNQEILRVKFVVSI